MVLCKYFQQGNCRFGQFCKFEHSYGNRSKTFGGDEKNIALLVAEEVLVAERGGQWLLSCFGPFKEKKCIPGMEDLSPEELRWEMYQAQKNGTVDQINTRFQQMCEDMKSKRDALKNPTPAIYQMLDGIKNSGTATSSVFGDASKTSKGTFPFGQSQLSASNTSQTSNVFGQKTFGTTPTSNVFGGTSAFPSSQNSAFGGNATFGSAPVFGGSSTFGATQVSRPNPFFTSTAATTTSTGSGTVFGATQASQPNPFFANTATTTTPSGSAGAFGSAQVSQPNPFFATTTSTSGTVAGFGGTTAARPNPFFANTGTTSSSAAPAFGGAPIFGGSSFGTPQNTGSVFGGQAFGSAGTATAPNSIFGGAGAASTSNSIFGASATPSSFGAIAQNATSTNVFGAAAPAVASPGNPFEVAPNVTPFGTAVSSTAPVFGSTGNQAFAPATTPAQGIFGSQTATPAQGVFGNQTSTPAQGVFGNQAAAPAQGVFGSQAAAPAQGAFCSQPSAPAQGAFGTQAVPPAQGVFGSQAAPLTQGAAVGFQTTAANTTISTNVFGAPTSQSVFGAAAPVSSNQSVFGSSAPQTSSTSVFGVSSAPPNASPFLPKTTTTTSSPFGSASVNQASPFGAFAKTGAQLSVTVIIDETGYTPDENLTDDEKAAYRSNHFVEGHIPLKPPSKELC